MRLPRPRAGARLGALLAWASLGTLLSGCSLFHHGHQDVGCRQPIFTGNHENLPPLKAPPGLNAPDSSQEIKVPTLAATPPAQPRGAPCLDWPPKYANEPLLPPLHRTPLPPPTEPSGPSGGSNSSGGSDSSSGQ